MCLHSKLVATTRFLRSSLAVASQESQGTILVREQNYFARWSASRLPGTYNPGYCAQSTTLATWGSCLPFPRGCMGQHKPAPRSLSRGNDASLTFLCIHICSDLMRSILYPRGVLPVVSCTASRTCKTAEADDGLPALQFLGEASVPRRCRCGCNSGSRPPLLPTSGLVCTLPSATRRPTEQARIHCECAGRVATSWAARRYLSVIFTVITVLRAR